MPQDKVNVLIVSDSAFLDSGFARVAREIGTGLVQTGKYRVAQLGCFHIPTDRFVPFHVYPVMSRAGGEMYGEKLFEEVVQRFRPDVVLTIMELWSIMHIVRRPRRYRLVSYVPIDGRPVADHWVDALKAIDHVVAYGNFGAQAILEATGPMQVSTVPHGVDTSVFKPMDQASRDEARSLIKTANKNPFIVGCVGRNSPRKHMPRLLKAFRAFISRWDACEKCGYVRHTDEHEEMKPCPRCGSKAFTQGAPKDDAYLYLHCKADDHVGFHMSSLVKRFGLQGRVAMPSGMQEECVGVSDVIMNRLYNALDLFTLPTGGEGFGLPILEAMSCGVPVLVTGYSGHVDFAKNAAEFISVNDWDTQVHNCAEHAIVDIEDYTRKLDRFYYEKDDFLAKWGVLMRQPPNNITDAQLSKMSFGQDLRRELGGLARERAELFEWGPIIKAWDQIVASEAGKVARRPAKAPVLELI